MLLRCASTNPGKLAEYRLAGKQFTVDVEPIPGIEACEETGNSFEANAIAKALHYSRHCTEAVFADDSGLVVDALEGAPGIYSARYAGVGSTDAANNALLLARMKGKTNRAARFVCVVALARQGELMGTFSGVVEGLLSAEPRGGLGFGYDPLFYYPEFGRTLAEVEAGRKLGVSHRGKALEAMFRFLLRKSAENGGSRPADQPTSSRR